MKFGISLSIVMRMCLWCATTAIAQNPRRALSDEAKQQVEAALPAQAPATPRASRKLLIYDGNVGYGGHGSIPYANHAFTRMGEKTGAFTTEVSRRSGRVPEEHLEQFDAVCLNNTVGNLFTDPVLRQNLLEFVLAGGGLLGIHGTTVAFTDFPNGAQETWPEFGCMLGGRGAAHLTQDEHVLVKLDDPDHPLNRPFGGQGFRTRRRVLSCERSVLARSCARAVEYRHGQDCVAARRPHAGRTTITPWPGRAITAADGSCIARLATVPRTSWTPRSWSSTSVRSSS